MIQHVFVMLPQSLLQNIYIDVTPDSLSTHDSDRLLVTLRPAVLMQNSCIRSSLSFCSDLLTLFSGLSLTRGIAKLEHGTKNCIHMFTASYCLTGPILGTLLQAYASGN